MKYTIYIDESGDAGLKKIRTRTCDGASPYMTMCACMIPNSKKEEIVEKIDQMRKTLGVRGMHTTNLKHSQKVFCAREISQLRLRLFGVISNKRTLKEYAKSIDGNSEKYYNKCAKYLLEKIGGYLSEKGIPAEDVSIIFEERKHNYSSLLAYITKVRKTPMYPASQKLAYINPLSISFEKKTKTALFFVPDFGAHALYQCFNKSEHNYFIPETRYLNELRNVFHRNEKSKKIGGVGIKYIQRLSDLEADDDVRSFLERLVAPSVRITR